MSSLLQFVSRSLDDVNSEEWLMLVGTAMGEKDLVVERYTNYPEEKVRCKPPSPCFSQAERVLIYSDFIHNI